MAVRAFQHVVEGRFAFEKACRRDVLRFEHDGDVAILQHRVVQIFRQLRLPVNHDALAAGQAGEIDALLPAGERQHDSVVDYSLAIHPGADVGLAHQVDHALLENAGTDARLDVFARVPLEDDARNAVQAEEAREAQARRAAADDANLRSHVIVPCEGSPPRWPRRE